MEICNIDFSVLKSSKFNKFFTKDTMSETLLMLIYQYVNIIKKIKNIHPAFKEDKFLETINQEETNVGKAILKVESLCKDILLIDDVTTLQNLTPEEIEKINEIRNLEDEMVMKEEKLQTQKEKITILEREVRNFQEKLSKNQEKIEELLKTHGPITDKQILEYEENNYYHYVKKKSKKNARKLGVEIDNEKLTSAQVLMRMNDLFSDAKKTADKNLYELRRTKKKLTKKLFVIENYKHFLDNLPYNQVYMEYENQKIQEVKDEITFILNQRENIIGDYIKNVSEKFKTIHINFLNYLQYLREKEEKLVELSETVYGDKKRLKEIIDASDNKLIEFSNKIKTMKEQKKLALLATQKMEKEYEEMKEELSEEYPYYFDRIIKLNTPSGMKDYYKYIKYKKYNAGKYKKTIENHLFCDCCKKIDQENIAGYKITPIVLDQLQKRGLDKIILFDIKNCCNNIEKLVLKALCVLKKKFGGKSSIWYRHYITDKFYHYNKKDINERFYYTFLSERVCEESIKYDDFKNEKNKKLRYYKYYSKLDKEAGTKITITMLSKDEIKYKNKIDNKHLTDLTTNYFKMFFNKGFKKTCSEDIKERVENRIKQKELYKKSKHLRTKRSHLEKKIIREGFIRKDDVLSFIKKEEKKGTFVPIIERVDYDIDLYEKTMEKIMIMANDLPDIMDLSEEGVRMIIGDYKKRIKDNVNPEEIFERKYYSDDDDDY